MKSKEWMAQGAENSSNVKGFINNTGTSLLFIWQCLDSVMYLKDTLRRKSCFLLDGLDAVWVGEREGHYAQSNEGIWVNDLLSKRYILPLPPLGRYSGPSMRLVIPFARPNCLSFCLLSIRGLQSLLPEWIFASGLRSIMWIMCLNRGHLTLSLKGNRSRCPLDSW